MKAASFFAGKLGSAFHGVRVERFYVLDRPPERIEPKVAVDFGCFRCLSTELAARLRVIKGRGADWRRRVDLGHRCYVTSCHGEPAGYGWVCPAAWLIGDEEPVGALANDVAYVYDEITRERFRGKRIGPARLAYIYNDMRREGYSRNCLTIADGNVASQRSVRAAGYRPTDCVVSLHRWLMVIRIREGDAPAELLAPRGAG